MNQGQIMEKINEKLMLSQRDDVRCILMNLVISKNYSLEEKELIGKVQHFYERERLTGADFVADSYSEIDLKGF